MLIWKYVTIRFKNRWSPRNIIILKFMQKDDLNVHVFQNRKWCSSKSDGWFFLNFWLSKDLSMGRIFRRKNMAVRGWLLRKRELCMYNLTKERKQPPVVTLQQAIFYSVLVAKKYQKIRSRCLVHEFSFTDIFNDINHDYRAAILK